MARYGKEGGAKYPAADQIKGDGVKGKPLGWQWPGPKNADGFGGNASAVIEPGRRETKATHSGQYDGGSDLDGDLEFSPGHETYSTHGSAYCGKIRGRNRDA
jgi:hypothetical protein